MLRSEHLSARVTAEQKTRYEAAAARLGMDLSDLITYHMDLTSRRIVDEGWECRLVYFLQGRVVGIGEEAPRMEEPGLPVPASAYPIVAPQVLWDMLEVSLRPVPAASNVEPRKKRASGPGRERRS